MIILIVILKTLKIELLLQHLNGVKWRFLAFASFTFIAGVCLNTLRLKLLFNEDIEYLQLLKINFIGLFFSIFLPGRTSGDIIRGYYISKTIKNMSQTVSILLIWRLIGIFSLIFIACSMSFFSYSIIEEKSIVYYPLSICAIFFLLVLLFSNIKMIPTSRLPQFLIKFRQGIISKFLASIYYDLEQIKNKHRVIIENIIISIASNVFMFFTWYYVSCSIDAKISIHYFFIFIPLVAILQIIPISLNGMGIREGATVFLFSKIGIINEISFIIALFYSTISILISLIGGLIYLLYPNES